MHILLVKLSSIGDLIHTFPAITDAWHNNPQIRFTWVVDESFTQIPAWHPAVEKVISVPLRNKNIRGLCKAFREIRAQKYDLVIDAQGLLKSALLAKCAKAHNIAGYDKDYCREPQASWFYSKKYIVDKTLHAITRMRLLFAKALNYSISNTPVKYGINWQKIVTPVTTNEPYILLLHGTTWDTKHWPEQYWLELIDIIAQHGYKMQITWANDEQRARAIRMSQRSKNVALLPHLSLSEAASVIYAARGAVAVDTGFAHLSAAMSKPLVAIYGATDPKKCGAEGTNSINLSSELVCAPCGKKKCSYTGESKVSPACYETITPQLVWNNLQKLLANGD